jgi:hypothetical protein
VSIVVPANGYLVASGSSWRCNRGYLDVNDRCVAIRVPPNAYLDDDVSGKGWRCDRDYREGTVRACPSGSRERACERVRIRSGLGMRPRIPPGRHLVPAGRRPGTGILSRSGNDWECERGFRKDAAACVAVQLPADAHLDYSGSDWRCNEGFHTHGALCAAD